MPTSDEKRQLRFNRKIVSSSSFFKRWMELPVFQTKAAVLRRAAVFRRASGSPKSLSLRDCYNALCWKPNLAHTVPITIIVVFRC